MRVSIQLNKKKYLDKVSHINVIESKHNLSGSLALNKTGVNINIWDSQSQNNRNILVQTSLI